MPPKVECEVKSEGSQTSPKTKCGKRDSKARAEAARWTEDECTALLSAIFDHAYLSSSEMAKTPGLEKRETKRISAKIRSLKTKIIRDLVGRDVDTIQVRKKAKKDGQDQGARVSNSPDDEDDEE